MNPRKLNLIIKNFLSVFKHSSAFKRYSLKEDLQKKHENVESFFLESVYDARNLIFQYLHVEVSQTQSKHIKIKFFAHK